MSDRVLLDRHMQTRDANFFSWKKGRHHGFAHASNCKTAINKVFLGLQLRCRWTVVSGKLFLLARMLGTGTAIFAQFFCNFPGFATVYHNFFRDGETATPPPPPHHSRIPDAVSAVLIRTAVGRIWKAMAPQIRGGAVSKKAGEHNHTTGRKG